MKKLRKGDDLWEGDRNLDESGNDIVELDYEPVRIQIRATSDTERRWRVRPCRKEPWTVEWIERTIEAGAVFYDIGANIGAFTLIATRRQPTATVVAFEPGYASYARLCDNLALNRCQGTVIPIPLPLWSRTTIMSLKYRDVTPGQSRHQLMQRIPPHGTLSRESRYEQPVLGITLDDLVRLFQLPLPTAVKLDVDGAETHVLQGAIDTFRWEGLKSVLVESSEETGAEVRTLLREAGFSEASVVVRDKPKAPIYAEFRRDRV